MKDQLSSLDLHFLVRELQCLVGARLQKAYQGSKERKRDLLFQFYLKGREGEDGKGVSASGTGERDAARRAACGDAATHEDVPSAATKPLLHVLLPGIAYLSEEKPPVEKTPGQFAVFLRKWVGNARLVAVEQQGFEKILRLTFENKDGRRTLVLELLPPGNALLLNEEGKIMNLLEPQRHGSRVLRGGARYEPPPPFFDTKHASVEEVAAKLFATDKDVVVKALAADLGLGSTYAEEVCLRVGVEKLAKPTRTELRLLAAAAKALFDEPSAPSVVGDEAFPFRLATKETGIPFSSFSAAIASLVPEEEAPAVAIQKTKRSKAEEVLKQQTRAVEGYGRAAEENQRKGELLYEHYQEVKALLDAVNATRKAKGWAAVKEEFKGKVVQFDEEKGTITIELE